MKRSLDPIGKHLKRRALESELRALAEADKDIDTRLDECYAAQKTIHTKQARVTSELNHLS